MRRLQSVHIIYTIKKTRNPLDTNSRRTRQNGPGGGGRGRGGGGRRLSEENDERKAEKNTTET